MTYDSQSTLFTELLQLLNDSGFDGMSNAIEILANGAMKLERAEALSAMPYQRSDSRRGYANGFKPKAVNSRLYLKVPQTRDVELYPSALERGERSERALKLAVAELYVQGVSTRKVAEITQELCGLDVSSSQVSRAAELLDEELHACDRGSNKEEFKDVFCVTWRSSLLGILCKRYSPSSVFFCSMTRLKSPSNLLANSGVHQEA